ncbi:MAG: hypothetical protein MUC86_06555, partial [Burkholderiaceae bacterium]|nr:hypothetical protein [Burkholderiaceae bacterium]
MSWPGRAGGDEASERAERAVAPTSPPPTPAGAPRSDDVDLARLRRNAPAIATDLALGLLFFVAAKLTDLRTAALIAAGAGIALYGVQWVLNR